jgi:hypothetical protein
VACGSEYSSRSTPDGLRLSAHHEPMPARRQLPAQQVSRFYP